MSKWYMKCLHLSRQSYSLDRCEQVERSKIMHQKCEKKFTKILLCLFSSVAKMFDNKGNSFWVFHSTTVTHNSKPGIIFYCITGDWMPNLSNLVHISKCPILHIENKKSLAGFRSYLYLVIHEYTLKSHFFLISTT